MFGSKIHKWTLLTFKKDVGLALETFLGIYSFNQSERLLKSEVNNEVGFSKKFRKAWFKLIPPQYSSDWGRAKRFYSLTKYYLCTMKINQAQNLKYRELNKLLNKHKYGLNSRSAQFET